MIKKKEGVSYSDTVFSFTTCDTPLRLLRALFRRLTSREALGVPAMEVSVAVV